MSRDELKELLESYWYDNQYLKEKFKEVESFNKLTMNHSDSEFIIDTKENEKSEIKKILEKKKFIESLIQQLQQPYRTILYMKYISFFTFDQIADKIHYSTKRIYQLHSDALNQLKIITSKTSKKLAQISKD